MTFQRFNKHAAKLTKADAFEIRRRWAGREEAPCTQSQLANEFGVSINTIRNVLSGNTFQEVEKIESPAEQELKIAQSQRHLAALLALDAGEEVELPPDSAEVRESAIEQIIRDRAGSDPLGDWRRQRQAAGLRPGTDDSNPSDSKEEQNDAPQTDAPQA